MLSRVSRESVGWRSVLDVASTVAVIVASLMLVWAVLSNRAERNAQLALKPVANSDEPLPAGPIALEGAARQGSPSASVAVIEYSDFECPFCVKFATTTYPEIFKQYVETGKVQFAFRHLPLEGRHPAAFRAAEAAECARRQGKFWAMHDALFAAPSALSVDSLFTTAQAAGVDVIQFRRCMDGEATAQVRGDIADARTYGIRGTPTFLFGKTGPGGSVTVVRRESGAIPSRAFAVFLDDLLKSTKPAR